MNIIKLPLIIYIPVMLLIGIIYIAAGTICMKKSKEKLKETSLRFLLLALVFTAIYYLG